MGDILLQRCKHPIKVQTGDDTHITKPVSIQTKDNSGYIIQIIRTQYHIQIIRKQWVNRQHKLIVWNLDTKPNMAASDRQTTNMQLIFLGKHVSIYWFKFHWIILLAVLSSAKHLLILRWHFQMHFPWKKCFNLWIKFHWSLLLSADLPMSQHCWGTLHYLDSWWPSSLYASPGAPFTNMV